LLLGCSKFPARVGLGRALLARWSGIVAAGNAVHNTLVTAMGMAKMATSYLRVQNDTRLLETALAALKMSEPYNNPVVMATVYDIMSAGYRLNPLKEIEYD